MLTSFSPLRISPLLHHHQSQCSEHRIPGHTSPKIRRGNGQTCEHVAVTQHEKSWDAKQSKRGDITEEGAGPSCRDRQGRQAKACRLAEAGG